MDSSTSSPHENTTDSGKLPPADTTLLVFRSVFTALTMSLSLMYAITCIRLGNLSGIPRRKFQLLVVFSIFLFLVLDVPFGWGPQTYYSAVWGVSKVCNVLLPLYKATTLLILYGLFLTSLERAISTWRGAGPAFSENTTNVLLFVAVTISVLVSYCSAFSIGMPRLVFFHGVEFCQFGDMVELVLDVFSMLGVILTLIMTMLLIARSCRVCGTYLLGTVLPIIAANIFFILGEALMLTMSSVIGYYTNFSSVLFIVAIWLFGEKELRESLVRCFLGNKQDINAGE